MAEWNIDLSEVNGLQRWYGTRPKMMQRASAMLLNRFAWGTRDQAVKTVDRAMVIRNPKFVSGRLKVTQTHVNTPIARQQSWAGSVATKRFSGWTEQEVGAATARKRTATLDSRKGSIRNQMEGRARLKPANTVATFGSLGYGKTPRGLSQSGGGPNYGGWIAMLMRQRYKGLIRIGKQFYVLPRTAAQRFVGPGRRGGVYWKQLILVQNTERQQPKRVRWMKQARAEYFRRNDPQRTWNAVVGRLMTPPPKR